MRAAALILMLLVSGCPKAAKPKALPRAGGVVDTHVHVAPSEIERLHHIMDEQGLTWVLNLSGRWPGGPGGPLEQQIAAANRSGRILVACNLPWVAARRTQQFPEIGVKILQRAKELGAVALKIEKALGLGAIKYDGTLLAVDDPWLDPIWKAAGDLGMPVVIHTGDPKAFWQKTDETNERFEELSAHPGWSNYGIEGLPSFEGLLAQLTRVVAKHRNTKFVSVHFGNNAEDPFWVAEQLDKYPNLYVDLAARLPEVGRHDPDKLRAMFTRHADRILFGTDLGVSPQGFLMLGSVGEAPDTRKDVKPYYDKHWRFLETADRGIPSPTPIQGRWTIDGLKLPDDVLVKIYRGNAERLFGKPKAHLPSMTSTASGTER